jgi:hypothetical protein
MNDSELLDPLTARLITAVNSVVVRSSRVPIGEVAVASVRLLWENAILLPLIKATYPVLWMLAAFK